MNNKILHTSFLEKITRKISEKETIADALTDILSVSRELICEKLNGTVPFTFDEAMIISEQLNISLDDLKTGISPMANASLKAEAIESTNPAKTDFALIEEMISILKHLQDVPNVKGGEITNILPQPLYMAHENIFKYYLFKWKFQSSGLKKATPFKDIVITDKLKKNQEDNVRLAKTIHTEYILDHLIFRYLINDIKYFHQIKLITDDEIELIKQDLLKILDQLDNWSKTEVFEETGKKINIYISDVNIETGYIYLDAPNYQLAIAKAFLLNGIASTTKVTLEDLKHWIQAIKRQSTLVTGCNEQEWIKFLEEQNVVIESLSQS